MSKWHPLTEELFDGNLSMASADSKLRRYLEEKAKELDRAWSSTYKAYNDQKVAIKLTREVLDLEESKESGMKEFSEKMEKAHTEEVKVGKEWCPDIVWNPYNETPGYWYWQCWVLAYSNPQAFNRVKEGYKFCPICGAPRPVEKSLVERVAERVAKVCDSSQNVAQGFYMEIARAAIDEIAKGEK